MGQFKTKIRLKKIFFIGIRLQSLKKMRIQGLFWPVLTTNIWLCFPWQKVSFFSEIQGEIHNSRNKQKIIAIL